MPSVSFDQLGVWIVCALLALDVYLRVMAHAREKRIAENGTRTIVSPDPLPVRQEHECATKPDLAAVEHRFNDEVHQLHERVSGVRKEADRKIDAIEKRIDAIPQRTIELLKTVKEYHSR